MRNMENKGCKISLLSLLQTTVAIFLVFQTFQTSYSLKNGS